MNKTFMLLAGAAALPVCLYAGETIDSVAIGSGKELSLDEVVVTGRRPALRHEPDRLVYIPKNDPYAAGLDAVGLLDRMPGISVVNDLVSVAGKSSVRYIVDGHLLEMTAEAVALKLKGIQAAGVEKVELLATPPARYGGGENVAYISITTRNEALGTRGSVWGKGTMREDFSYNAGGNISHSTRRTELSADVSWDESRGINDLTRSYVFPDHERLSDRSSRFLWRTLGLNGLFRYRFSSGLSAGAIVNYSAMPIKSTVTDVTCMDGKTLLSTGHYPAGPDNALTLTAFGDWTLDSYGKTLSLTYNMFDRRIKKDGEVSTVWDDAERSELSKHASNRYRIHSVKLDAALPFPGFRMEAGMAFTSVSNNTSLDIAGLLDGNWVNDPSQSNVFEYDEKTVAAYASAERSFSKSLFGKFGVRYEHTWVTGFQHVGAVAHDSGYGHFLPSFALSLKLPRAGRLSLDFSMGISRPSFGDLNPFRYYNTVADYFTGNPDLEPVIAHNAGINYSCKGLYAVLYGSCNHNAVGYVTRFGSDGMQVTRPENCLNTLKTGVYVSYGRSLFSWWNIKAGGEVFYSKTESGIPDFRDADDHGWSGKIELNTSWMLNHRKTLLLNLRATHFFPYRDRMFHYKARTVVGCELRWMLLDNRLTLSLSVNDPFGWSVSRSVAYYSDYTLSTRNDIHSHSVGLRIAWSFGRDKVSRVYRDPKERESSRSH